MRTLYFVNAASTIVATRALLSSSHVGSSQQQRRRLQLEQHIVRYRSSSLRNSYLDSLGSDEAGTSTILQTQGLKSYHPQRHSSTTLKKAPPLQTVVVTQSQGQKPLPSPLTVQQTRDDQQSIPPHSSGFSVGSGVNKAIPPNVPMPASHTTEKMQPPPTFGPHSPMFPTTMNEQEGFTGSQQTNHQYHQPPSEQISNNDLNSQVPASDVKSSSTTLSDYEQQYHQYSSNAERQQTAVSSNNDLDSQAAPSFIGNSTTSNDYAQQQFQPPSTSDATQTQQGNVRTFQPPSGQYPHATRGATTTNEPQQQQPQYSNMNGQPYAYYDEYQPNNNPQDFPIATESFPIDQEIYGINDGDQQQQPIPGGVPIPQPPELQPPPDPDSFDPHGAIWSRTIRHPDSQTRRRTAPSFDPHDEAQWKTSADGHQERWHDFQSTRPGRVVDNKNVHPWEDQGRRGGGSSPPYFEPHQQQQQQQPRSTNLQGDSWHNGPSNWKATQGRPYQDFPHYSIMPPPPVPRPKPPSSPFDPHQQPDWTRPLSSEIQGESRSTWQNPFNVDRVMVDLYSDGRPIDTEVELWQGPSNTPHKIKMYSEDGGTRPFKAVIETPGYGSSIDIKNSGPTAFPIRANVQPLPYRYEPSRFKLVQGENSLYTVSLSAYASSALVTLETDGMPLMALVELWQGPDNTPQKLKVYNEQGLPFQIMVETPGPECTIAVRNVAPMEFPLYCAVSARVD